MFETTSRNGFHITFSNGYTVSVQWNGGNYCDDRSMDDTRNEQRECRAAEVAAWADSGEWVKLSENDDVIGWQTAEQVAAIMTDIASRPAA